MDYHEWIPIYPDIKDTTTFQHDISILKEFVDTKSDPNEQPPKKAGDYFNYQVFDKRFMRYYDRLLMFFEAGTGKTCSYISVAEDYQKSSQARVSVLTDALFDYYNTYQGIIKNVIILLKGKSLMDELKRQLMCKCTAGNYITDLLLKAKSEKSQKSAVSRSIHKWYTIDTYGTFCNNLIKKNLSDEQLAEQFNGCIFICDEIHSVKYELVPEEDDEGITEDNIDDETNKEDAIYKKNELFKKRYNFLWKLFHAPKFCKVILATATPMINDANDLIGPMNLILPKNQQIPLNADLKRWSLELFQKYMMGYISFVRAGDTGVDKVYTGNPLNKVFLNKEGQRVPSQMTVEQYEMLPFQRTAYLQKIFQKQSNKNVASNNMIGFRNNERQISAFVFPDGSYGGTFPRLRGNDKSGLGKYVSSKNKDDYKLKPDFKEHVNSINKIKKLSILYGNIVDKAMKSTGICFIYNELLFGSGAIALAMCFEAMGFERFSESTSVFQDVKSQYRLQSYCSGTDSKTRTLKYSKKLRYAMITSETSDTKIEKLKELLNSVENKHGDYIKILIGSEVTRDGINLSNVQDVFLPSMWTPAGMYQAEQRAIRAVSHVNLVEDGKRVKVKIHRMGCYAIDDVNKIHSVDLDMYAIAEKKDRDIAIVRRKVKQISVDGIIQYDRNSQEPSSLNYTSLCDYDVCKYKTVNEVNKNEPVDYNNALLFYSEDVMKKCHEVIQNILIERPFFDVGLLSHIHPTIPYHYWEMSITDIVDKKILLTNRFNCLCLLERSKSYCYLVPFESESMNSVLDNYYAGVIYTTRQLDFNDYVSEQAMKTKKTNAENIEGESYDVAINAILMESATLKSSPNELSEKERYILQRYKNYLFEFKEPTKEIEKQMLLRDKKIGRGRKALEGKVNYTEKILPSSVEIGEKVLVHSMYTIPKEQTGYNVTAKFLNAKGRLRLYKPSEGTGWREVSNDELIVYNSLIRGRIRAIFKPYLDSKLFGSILSDNEFRVHDLRNWKPTDEEERYDLRKIPHGLACKESWKNDQLLEILYQLKVPPPAKISVKLNKKELLSELSKKSDFKNRFDVLPIYTEDQLKYMYVWTRVQYNRPILCNIMKDAFMERNLLFEM
jgi:hypothetical protein